MDSSGNTFPTVAEMLRAMAPVQPAYCIYPHVYQRAAREFVSGFPGRVLYAVKANDHPAIVRLLYEAGVKHFDCASLKEIEIVNRQCADARCYFMTPVRLRGAARDAQARFGVRHFMIDHHSGLKQLAAEIDLPSSVVFVRMAVHHATAMENLSAKFGAPPADIDDLMTAVASAGAEPALAFNVGSAVTSADAYAHSIDVASQVLADLSVEVRLVDIGGGFAKSYPGFPAPPVSEYIRVISSDAGKLRLADGGTIMCEPGRALAAPGLSAVTEVLLRKNRKLYLNDGMYGIFWELRCNGHDRYPVRCFRNGRLIDSECRPFKLYGPTCDSADILPGEVELPADVDVGDYLEFGSIGAYSLAGRTDFNGHRSDIVVTIETGAPPAVV